LRRISVEHAELGMTLARAVHDGRGTVLLDAGTPLDGHHLPVLSRLEVKDIFVIDQRVDDVIIVPLISEALEAQAVTVLHRLVDSNKGKTIHHVKLDLTTVDRVIKSMIQGLYSVFMGEIDLEGCLSLGNYDYIHPTKVVSLSLLIGKEADYSKSELVNLGMSALLQNIGYLFVPPNILASLDQSIEEKSAEFRKHPEYGSQILHRSGETYPEVAETILQHHERWNGSGYPRGLKGKEISLSARIIAIADTYHALVSRRPHKDPHSPPEAAEFITAYSGELFDPELVQLFIQNIPFYPKGVMVKLSTGETGIVTNTNIGYIGRPIIRICYDRNGCEVPKPYDIDLSKPEHQSKVVVEILEY
jgi:HD-GYP domain-containing protein (c-di-GMP phosphodiesterase class II)